MSQNSFLVEKATGKRIKIGGCVPSTKRPSKSHQYQTSRYSQAELPSKVDLRPYLTEVEDQSAVNSCTANAVAGAYEYLAKRELGESGDISRLFIYYNARQWDEIEGDRGSTITGSIQVLEEMGACTEETWPYDPDRVDDEPHGEAYEEALNFLVEDALEIDVDLYTMKHCLAEGYPFIFGLKLFKSFDRAGRKGIVPVPDPRTQEGRETHGNHAMLCVGYSDQQRMFVVRNSWGPDWGDRGYCYIPYDYMANPEYCWDCWAVRSVSDLDFSTNVWYDEEEDDGFYEEEDEEYDEEDSDYYYAYNDEDEEYDEDEEDDEDDEEYDEDDEEYDEDEEDDENEEYDDENDEEYDDEDDEEYDEDDEEYDEDEYDEDDDE